MVVGKKEVIFLIYLSKVFDKAWHQGVLFKLKQNGISLNLLKTLEYFLVNRYQRVELNGQVSRWAAVNTGVVQDSIVGPLLFLIYSNDLSNRLPSNLRLFADDMSLFPVDRDVTLLGNVLNNNLLKINNWAYQ